MAPKTRTLVGMVVMAIGLLIIAFSEQIVFPGLERIVGIETIVGKNNVSYEPDGTYHFTNPGAMARWVSAVALVGMGVCVCGFWFSGMRLKFTHKNRS